MKKTMMKVNRFSLDMSSRQRLKTVNDIFEMISDNDEEIKFDDCGILKPVTVSKSTIVVVSSMASRLSPMLKINASSRIFLRFF